MGVGLPFPSTKVPGPAAGAGMSLALMGDLILCARSAYFLQAFRRIGLVPDCGSTWLLPRLVGRARAIASPGSVDRRLYARLAAGGVPVLTSVPTIEVPRPEAGPGSAWVPLDHSMKRARGSRSRGVPTRNAFENEQGRWG